MYFIILFFKYFIDLYIYKNQITNPFKNMKILNLNYNLYQNKYILQ